MSPTFGFQAYILCIPNNQLLKTLDDLAEDSAGDSEKNYDKNS